MTISLTPFWAALHAVQNDPIDLDEIAEFALNTYTSLGGALQRPTTECLEALTNAARACATDQHAVVDIRERSTPTIGSSVESWVSMAQLQLAWLTAIAKANDGDIDDAACVVGWLLVFWCASACFFTPIPINWTHDESSYRGALFRNSDMAVDLYRAGGSMEADEWELLTEFGVGEQARAMYGTRDQVEPFRRAVVVIPATLKKACRRDPSDRRVQQTEDSRRRRAHELIE